MNVSRKVECRILFYSERKEGGGGECGGTNFAEKTICHIGERRLIL